MRTRIKILLPLLALSLAFVSCGREQKQTLSEQMEQQISLLPQDAGVYAYVNIRRLHEASFTHDFIDSARKQILHNPEFLDLIEQTGLDPEHDIREVYFALKPGSSKGKPLGLVMADGDFDPQKITGFLMKKDKQKHILKESYKEKTLYFSKKEASGFCFFDTHTLVAGNLEQVKAWIDRREAGGIVTKNEALLSQVKEMKYNSGMWLNVIPSAWNEMLQTKDLKKLNGLKKLQKVWVSMDIRDRILFSANGVFSNTEDAQLFKDAFKGLIAAGKLAVSDERDVVDILNKIDVQTQGKTISVEFKLGKEDARKLLEKKKKLHRKIMPV